MTDSNLDTDDIPPTSLDPPARIGIIGAGPVGIEAALYARFLGYEVIVWDQGEVAESVSKSSGEPISFKQLSTQLAINALSAQSEDYVARNPDDVLTAEDWRNEYLLPLSKTDLIRKLFNTQTEIEAVTESEPPEQVEGEDDPPPTAFTIRAADGQTWENIAAVFDTAGSKPFIEGVELNAEAIAANQSDPTELAEALVTSITNYYVLGAKSWGKRKSDFRAVDGHNQIRAVFTLIGERADLDLYG